MAQHSSTGRAGITIPAALLVAVATAPAANAAPDLKTIEGKWTLLNDYCVTCHNFEDWAGGVAFDTLTPDTVSEHADVWESAVRKMRGRLMPPPGEKKPADAVLNDFVATMEDYLDATATSRGPAPGHVVIHRMNRTEYANAIEDLLALKVDGAALLPPDMTTEGFDNVAEVLQVSPSFLDQYISAARSISIQAVGAEKPEPDLVAFPAPSVATQYRHVAGLPLGTRGGFAVEHYFPADGDFQFTVSIASQEGSVQRSYPTWWLESKHRFILTIDGEEVFTTELGGYDDEEAVDKLQQPAISAIMNRFENIHVPVTAGNHVIGASFVARTFAESDRIVDHLSPGEGMDNIPLVTGFKVLGPFNVEGVAQTESRKKIFTCTPANDAETRPCAEQIMTTLARQAFRRPATHADLATLMGFYDAGAEQGGFEVGIQKSIMALLASPKFLYRVETLPETAVAGDVFPLTDFELASRLSYFLWSRSPDDTLLKLAEDGQLQDKKVLRQQVERMLADPRAAALTENFAFRWLRVEDVDAIDPDPRLFPEFDPDLRASFKTEIALFVDSVLRGDRSVVDLLTADHTYVNERLARHYGITGERGSQFRKVVLTDEHRWGLLGKGGLLMLTSYPNRTSPVLRGAYIMETLIGVAPAAPPPGVETDLDTRKPGTAITTIRARLENHREQPQCFQCHSVIDPLGLALENFNAIGQWRDKDRYAAAPIDAAGQLASGQPVTGPDDLRKALASQPDHFVQALTEKLMTYALGRTVEYHDMPAVREVVRNAADEDYHFTSIVMGIIDSAQFRMKSVPQPHEKTGEAAELSLKD
ncbi:MAG: DUF1592 domain-containing protein [Gammaproteobacteria bacterium]|nr:DUF1592 domain-containing protein [Gammaproteobacteria bacterium]